MTLQGDPSIIPEQFDYYDKSEREVRQFWIIICQVFLNNPYSQTDILFLILDYTLISNRFIHLDLYASMKNWLVF